MSRIGLGRFVSVLDDDTPDTPVDNGEVAVEEEVSAPIVEATEETAEVEAEDIGAEQAMDSTETLEEVEDAVVAAEADGGLDRQSAVFAHLAMKAAMGKADYDYFVRSSKIPSVESYNGGSSSRQRYTAITREGLGTALRGFWEAIVRQIKKMWAAVKNWYLKVLDAAPRMKARAEALAKKSGDITGSASEKSFDMGGLNQLGLGGKAPDPSKAKEIMKVISEGADKLLGDKTSGNYEKLFDEYEKMLDQVENLNDDDFGAGKAYANVKDVATYYATQSSGSKAAGAKNLVVEFNKLISEAKTSIKATGGIVEQASKRFGDDITVTGSVELFGSKQIACFEPNDGIVKSGSKANTLTMARFARNAGIRFIDFKEKPKDTDSSGSFKTLSSSDIRTLMDELSDICEHIITYKKSWEKRDKQFDKMDKSAKKAIANTEKDRDAVTVKVRIVKDVAIGMSAAYQLGIRFENQFIQYCLAVGRATITWVERSLAQYKSA